MSAVDHPPSLPPSLPVEEANAWLVHLASPEATAQSRARYAAWRAAAPAHEAAAQEAERLWGELGEWQSLAALEPLEAATWKERLVALAAAAGDLFARKWARRLLPAGAAALVLFFLWSGGVSPWSSKTAYATATAELRQVTLADGSVVTLGAQSALTVHFTEQERRVVLQGGEAFFAVKGEAARPFLVAVEDTLVRVVGTKFNIRHTEDQVRVSVLEGVVEVFHDEDQLAGEATPQRLTAGQEVIAAQGAGLAAVSAIGAAPPDAWRAGRLIYADAALAEVVADANRYYDGHIEIADPALKELRVTTAFRTDQVAEMIVSLELTLPLAAESTDDGNVLLRAKPSAP